MRFLDELNWMRDVPQEELLFTPPKVENTLELNENDFKRANGFGLGLSLVLWSCTAFLCTIALCSLMENFTLAVLKR